MTTTRYITGLLCVTFVILKATETVAWSWLWLPALMVSGLLVWFGLAVLSLAPPESH